MKSPIKAVLFDLDNTLIDTHAVFMLKKEEITQAWKKYADTETVTAISTDFDTLLTEAFGLYTVNPNQLWPHVIAGLSNKYPILSAVTQEGFDILWSIYTYLPQAFPGASELLKQIQDSHIPVGLVTHAEKEWTDFKIDGHKFRNYFNEIIICDVRRPKNASDWKQAIDALGVSSGETIVFGDSIPGDILPAHGLGVKNLMWVNVSHGWNIYKQGTLPDEIEEINDLTMVSLNRLLSP